MNVVVWSSLDKSALARTIHRIVSRLDRTLPIIQLRTMDDVFEESEARPRFLTVLLGRFATVALVLSATRHPWRARVLGGRTAARDRHSARARRQRERRLADGIAAGPGLAIVGLSVGLVDAAALTRLHRRSCSAWNDRSAHVHGVRALHAPRRGARVHCAGAPGNDRGPVGGTPDGLIRAPGILGSVAQT